MEKKNIYGISLEELEQEMLALGQKAYRAKQLFSWLYVKNAKSFDEMSDISIKFREVLKERYTMDLPEVFIKRVSNDGTIKLLLKMFDGEKIETVLMPYNYGNATCISTQVGCNMNCFFCASGLLKKKRDLTTEEMVGQVLVLNKMLSEMIDGKPVTHIVVMGTGEPFDNYDNVMRFVRIVNSQFGLAIGARHITVSTSGVIPGILRYGKEGLQINLAISLHAPNNELRNKLMPINRKYPLEQLMEAVIQYGKDSNDRRVTYEYIMIEDFNDSMECCDQLIELIKPTYGYVNLIPYNNVVENRYKRSSNNRIHRFHDKLMKSGIKTTIRKEFGADIEAACGQLRAKYAENN
ncbi:MAG TPA: 23S rRNA (adenine(2503)-C(2))-methyltransferase RlmN [Firmicutes bacterium]|nr:23S rRNA (adenine(2503)-C(2))-methyltransferase RlmN [Bacillota bacterium]